MKKLISHFKIVGWKCYLIAAAAIIAGCIALYYRHWGEGVKGIIVGLALIAVRDAIGKLMWLVEENRKTLANLRAVIEASLSKESKW